MPERLRWPARLGHCVLGATRLGYCPQAEDLASPAAPITWGNIIARTLQAPAFRLIEVVLGTPFNRDFNLPAGVYDTSAEIAQALDDGLKGITTTNTYTVAKNDLVGGRFYLTVTRASGAAPWVFGAYPSNTIWGAYFGFPRQALSAEAAAGPQDGEVLKSPFTFQPLELAWEDLADPTTPTWSEVPLP